MFQLSASTIEVLKNFASINTGLFFKEGKKQRTISSTKSILAEAVLDDALPSSFGIYDLNNFLAIIGFDDVKTSELSYEDPTLTVKLRDQELMKFRCCESKMLVTPPNKDLDLGTVDVKFDLTEEALSRILKAASILSSPNIVVESDGTKMVLATMDVGNDSAHQYSCTLGQEPKQVFQFVFRTDNWKMLPGAYHVEISSKGLSKFTHATRPLMYWLALESTSKSEK